MRRVRSTTNKGEDAMRIVRLVFLAVAIMAATQVMAAPGPCQDCVIDYGGDSNCNKIYGDSWGCWNTTDGCVQNYLYCVGSGVKVASWKIASVEVIHRTATPMSHPVGVQLAEATMPHPLPLTQSLQ